MKHPVKKVLAAGLTLAMLTASPALALSTQDNLEVAASTDIRVNSFVDSVDVDLADGVCLDASSRCSLRAAIQTANAGEGHFEITMRVGTHVLTIPGDDLDGAEAGDLDVTGDINLEGRKAIVELAGFGDRAFDVAVGGDLRVDSLTVQNASLTGGESGGAFRNAGALELEVVIATGNSVSGEGASGGAIMNTGDIYVSKSTLTGNSATRAGGAIEANEGSTVVYRTTMSNNTAGAEPGNGGALHLTGAGYVKVTRSAVNNNTASSEGGALWNSSTGEMILSRSSLSGNVANGEGSDNGGGGLYNDGGEMLVSRSNVRNNSAPMGSASGGGILNNAGDLTVSKSTVNGNTAQRAGGAIETIDGTLLLVNSTVDGNSTGAAPGNGGGVHASGTAGTVTLNFATITNNTAALEGGGLWAGAAGSTMIVKNSIITDNVANGVDSANGGGGIFNKGGKLTVKWTKIARNTATAGSGSGGGILNLGTLDVVSSEISSNSAARAGGGIESNEVNGAGNATLSLVKLLNNTTGAAPGNGGGMHVTGSTITTTIDSSVVKGNNAANEGGGLWNFQDATMTVTNTVIDQNTSPVALNVFQNGDGGNFTVDGFLIPPGDNTLAFP